MIALVLLVPAGLLLGVFIAYLADVLPYTRRFSAPLCAYCGKEMSWRHYLSFHRCENCGKSRRWRNWLLPVLAPILVCEFWFFPPKHLEFWWAVILLSYFSLVAITDLEYRAILNQVSMAGALIGLAAGITRHGLVVTLIGGAAGFGVMLALYYLGALFGRFLARRQGITLEDEEALGFGDVYLTGIIGLILGWPAVTAGLFFGIVLAGLAGGGYLLYAWITHRYQAGTFLPYAPFLVLGSILVLYPPW